MTKITNEARRFFVGVLDEKIVKSIEESKYQVFFFYQKRGKPQLYKKKYQVKQIVLSCRSS